MTETLREQIIAPADNRGPTEAQWLEMSMDSAKFTPLITRLAGFYVLHGAAENYQDFPLIIAREFNNVIPGFKQLTEDEVYFIHTGAVNVICKYNAFAAISEMSSAWLEDGAPE